MKSFAILLRGINVGGKNKVPMIRLKSCLETHGFVDVITYIQSGNVLVRSKLSAESVSRKIEAILQKEFKLDSKLVKTLAIDCVAYKKVITGAPEDFGKEPELYRYNVMFLMGISAAEAMKQIETREGVDTAWKGGRVIYFRNSVAQASKSRLSRLAQKPMYPSITIRNWNTTRKLLDMLEAHSTR